MKNKLVIFNVTGKGWFPYDMLRYDQCYPCNVQDSGALEYDRRDKRTVELATTKRWATDARWASFGWVVDYPL